MRFSRSRIYKTSSRGKSFVDAWPACGGALLALTCSTNEEGQNQICTLQYLASNQQVQNGRPDNSRISPLFRGGVEKNFISRKRELSASFLYFPLDLCPSSTCCLLSDCGAFLRASFRLLAFPPN